MCINRILEIGGGFGEEKREASEKEGINKGI
jgi:hypothetical protein